MDRATQLIQIRPHIPAAKTNEHMGKNELFQNSTLRPILKLQNHLLLAVFKNYIAKHKNSFYELSLQKKLAYIENAIQKDVKFRNSLKGIIIGMFTLAEYETYILDSSALNKRMMQMVIERLKDQIQFFELPVLV
ncbi:glyoxalase [Arenibacter sp. GZD96]|uniref:hypothetical protein n=1 Tax=Aurantibrevibacter litoralis TaxID=3106030 RepID=UPI002AFF1CDF|nr:hypothetical protein [Arenibacter sp. GZD-96]MEA1785321.1 glyoxalase [Arenibacter sp. GZD-96]